MGKQEVITPEAYKFPDDGIYPNNVLPLLFYRSPLGTATEELATRFEDRFASNDWTNSWRGVVYEFAHYHSTTHEVLAVSRGYATLELGGPVNGSPIRLMAGDVIVIPAGVAHQQILASDDFEVVGAYPGGREWDVLKGHARERPAADNRIAALPIPSTDPLYGIDGPLPVIWRTM